MGNRAKQFRQQTAISHPGYKVVERTQHGIVHGHLGRRTLDTSVAEIHWHDGAAWQETDTEIRDAGDVAFDHEDKDALPYRFKFSDAGRRRIMPRQDFPDEYIEFDRLETFDTSWVAATHPTPTRVDNRLQWQQTNWGVGYNVQPTGVKATYVARTSGGARDIRWPYTLFGLTRSGNELISDADSTTVMNFQAASLVDADGTNRVVSQTIDATHVTLTPDYSGLVFPVRVDPTLDRQISAGADDGNRLIAADSFSSSTAVTAGDAGAADDTNAWYRFPNITIANAATIDVAHITQTRVAGGSGTVLTNIFAVAEDDHVAPTTGGEWDTDHGIHTSGITWDFAQSDTGIHNTPSIVTPIQAIINRGGWATGQAIGIHIDDDGSANSVRQEWDDAEGTTAASLHIEYTVFTWEQEGYRWRNDDGSESAATWHAAQDTDGSDVGTEITRRLRLLGNATDDPDTMAAKLQYRKVGDADSEWEDVL